MRRASIVLACLFYLACGYRVALGAFEEQQLARLEKRRRTFATMLLRLSSSHRRCHGNYNGRNAIRRNVHSVDRQIDELELEDKQNDLLKSLDELLKRSIAEAEHHDPGEEMLTKTKLPTEPKGDVLSLEKLHNAASQMDAATVSAMLGAGLEMDEATTEAAFWAVVKEVDRAEEEDEPLSTSVPQMLHHIFDADLRHLLGREKLRTNLTCKQPEKSGLTTAGMSYIFDDTEHKNLPLKEGRKCEGGNCCDKCSRNIFPAFATDAETSFESFPGLESLTFNELEKVSTATILNFMRLIERVRRTIAHEYGLPLSSVLPLQAYSRKYVAGTTQQGGGGGEGDYVTLHTDEATHSGYHYSCVIYFSTQGKDFEGGDFVFNDPAKETSTPTEDEPQKLSLEEQIRLAREDAEKVDDEEPLMSLEEQIRRAGREFTPYHPKRGGAVIYSSGWENMHEVDKITSGTRYVVPCFFTTCPVPEVAYEHIGKPKTDEDIADDWLHLLLAHQPEEQVESVARVKQLMMKWHYMCTPLSQH